MKKPVLVKTKKTSAVEVKPAIVPSNKELVGSFLEGKSFLNSRQAFRKFVDEASKTVKISQAYFYTLFKMFGKREKKSEGLVLFVNPESYVTPMAGYKAYIKGLDAEVKGVSFAYFLNVWKRTNGITGSVRTKAKPAAKKVRTIKLTINIKTLSAREIQNKIAEIDAQNAILSYNTKNKTKIVKDAVAFLSGKGYAVKA